MALELAGKSPAVWICCPVGTSFRKGLTPVFFQVPPEATEVINPGPLREKGTITVTLGSVVTALLHLALAVGTEWTGRVVLQARTKTTGRDGVISGCCYCLDFA